MLSWLYDEDRWPSGFAGGIVTREKRFRAKRLLWTMNEYRGEGTLLAQYAIALKDGRLSRVRRLRLRETTDATRPAKPQAAKTSIWSAYLETTPEDSWFNGQTNVDTFNRQAIERFIEVTHERFASALGKYFGNVIPAIFTDEPQFRRR